MSRNRATLIFLVAVAAAALCLCYLLVAPFLKPVLLAFVVAIVCHLTHTRIRRWVRNRSAAAALSTTAAVLLIGAFLFFIVQALLSGLRDIYDSLAASGENKERLGIFILHLFDGIIAWASHYVPISAADLQGALLNQVEKAVAAVLGATGGLLANVSSLGLNTFIAILVLFFALRDGRSVMRRLAVVSPLRPGQAYRLFNLVKQTLEAIVYGTLAMAAVQGSLTGLAFWILGLTSPVVWGMLASVLAIFPVVGTTLVWLPAAGMLLFSGHWIKGIVLILWGAAIVHPVDNFLRPYLIGSHMKVSVLYIFFALLGGIKAFGALGIFVGPLILSLTVALFQFLRAEGRMDRRHIPQESVHLKLV